jgi:general nucleoside transport system ATP-binding protein
MTQESTGPGSDGKSGAIALSVRGLTVRFGSVSALDDVSFSLGRGQVHAIVGQNGAGKTTLARTLIGLQLPDAGDIQINAATLPLGSVKLAKLVGVEMVHQSFSLPPSATVAEVVEFFRPTRRSLRPFRKGEIAAHAKHQLASVGVNIDPNARISSLPVETLQSLEIGRALLSKPRVLILDEPTAVLAPPEVRALFDRVRSIAASGVTVVIVLHKVREVLSVADTVTVLRRGRCVAAAEPTATIDERRLAQMIIGEDLPADPVRTRRPTTDSHHLLTLSNVRTAVKAGDAPLDSVSFAVRNGEILGIAGVEGNGQRSLVEAIVGMHTTTSGSIELTGTDVTHASVTKRRRRGLRVIPFERQTEGLSTTRSLWENVVSGELAVNAPRFGLVSPRRLKRTATTMLDGWQVQYNNVAQTAGSLSGGNAQRVILARELRAGLRVLVAAHPTRGLDVGAASFVQRTLDDLASDAAVLLVSADLDELFAMSDRIVVLAGGRVTGTFERPFVLDDIGAAMVGAAA